MPLFLPTLARRLVVLVPLTLAVAAVGQDESPATRPVPPNPVEGPSLDLAMDKAQPPVLYLTEETLARVKANVERGEEPWKQAWERVVATAGKGLDITPTPYEGEDQVEMRFDAFEDLQYARAMALCWRVTGDEQYARKAREILLAWATHEPTVGSTLRVEPPGAGGRWGGAPDLGLNYAYVAAAYAHPFAMLYPSLSEEDVEQIEPWLTFLGERIIESHRDWLENDCFDHQYYNNHLSGHNLGLASIGFALRDERFLREAFASGRGDYFDMVSGTILMPEKSESQFWYRDARRGTQPGEIYDRYRVVTIRDGKGYGIPYSFMHLKLLLYTTEIAHNNGFDLYEYTGPHGERLEVAYEHLAPYLITMDPGLHGEYHANDWIDTSARAQYEIVHQRLGPRELFAQVLESGRRTAYERSILGHQTLLLYGDPLAKGGENGGE